MSIPQRSPEWFDARRGIPTASRFDRIVTPVRGDPSSAQDGLIDELIAESLVRNDFMPERMSSDMLDGVRLEAEARCCFELDFAMKPVQECGFVLHPSGLFGGSPDAIVGDDSGVEIKCPTARVHVGYIRGGALPRDHKLQVHGYMAVTQRPQWSFLSYCRGIEPFHVLVPRSDFTKRLEDELFAFGARYNEARAKFGLPQIGTAQA